MNFIKGNLKIDVKPVDVINGGSLGKIHYGILLMESVELIIHGEDKSYRYLFENGKILTKLNSQDNPHENVLDLVRYTNDWDGLYRYPLAQIVDYPDGTNTLDKIRTLLNSGVYIPVYLGYPSFKDFNLGNFLTSVANQIYCGKIKDVRDNCVYLEMSDKPDMSIPLSECNRITILNINLGSDTIIHSGFLYPDFYRK